MDLEYLHDQLKGDKDVSASLLLHCQLEGELDLPLDGKKKWSEIPKEDSLPITSVCYLKNPESLMQAPSTTITNKVPLVPLQESALALYCSSNP